MKWTLAQQDSRFVEVDGRPLHYKRSGHGPTVLLLHGSGASLHQFTDVSTRLSDAFDVIRLDLPGFGLTGPRPDRDYRVTTCASTIARFLAQLDVPSVTVVGSSLGGHIAWNLALDHPSLVRALVLVNATGYPGKSRPMAVRLAQGRWSGALLRTWMPKALIARNLRAVVGRDASVIDDARVERAFQLMCRPGNRSAFVDVVATLQPDRSHEIGRIRVPTLVLRSAGIDGQFFARDIEGAVEKVHPTGGHLLPEEDPAWVSQAVATFLHGLDDPTTSSRTTP